MYWKGQGKNKPLIVKFQNSGQKGIIFKHVANLKDKANQESKNYWIADHVPEEMLDDINRPRQIMRANEKLEAAKLSMEIKKGKLYVNEQMYRKKVHTPRARELLSMKEEDIQGISSKQLADGGTKIESCNRFIAYSATVKNLADVRTTYLHMKRLHGDASHISMAYRLAGINKADDEDYINDREHGSGPGLLSLLIKERCHICDKVLQWHSHRSLQIPNSLRAGTCCTG